jgi:hypothetical protein|tara:strand:- start:106 stop:402 length:297 start_codon:yes stop_codon:yes gene_type:complete
MKMNRWSSFDKYTVLSDRSDGLNSGYQAYLEFQKVVSALQEIRKFSSSKIFIFEGGSYNKKITSSKADSILENLENCKYSSDIRLVANQIGAMCYNIH